MSEYIKREDAERAIEEDFRHACRPYEWIGLEDALDDLSHVPSADVVEVVRCAHCKRYDRHNHRCKWFNHGISNIDYCSYGERKDGEKHE